MAEETKKVVRKASVIMGGAAGEFHAEGITISAEIDSAPIVSVVARRGSEKVVRPLSSEVMTLMKAAQEARLTPKTSFHDTTVTVTDGNDGTLLFRGYAVSISLEHSGFNNSEVHNVTGSDAFLDGLDMSLYRAPSQELRDEMNEMIYTATPSASEGEVSATMLEIFEVLLSNLSYATDRTESASMLQLLEFQHASNQLPAETFRSILGNSVVNYPNWKAAFKELPTLDRALVNRLRDMLQQRTGSFWGNLRAIGSEFQFFYKPSVDGSPGMLVRADEKVKGKERAYATSVIRFNASDGTASMLPLAAVVVIGPSVAALRAEKAAAITATVVGRWPDQLPPGYAFTTQAPAWMVAGADMTDLTPAEDPSPPSEPPKKNLDPADYEARLKGAVTSLRDLETPIETILRDYAKVMFDDMQLADSTATLTMPLDLTLEVGVRYRFNLDSKGGSSFAGFVRALRHSLRLESGTQVAAETTLTLTHLKYD